MIHSFQDLSSLPAHIQHSAIAQENPNRSKASEPNMSRANGAADVVDTLVLEMEPTNVAAIGHIPLREIARKLTPRSAIRTAKYDCDGAHSVTTTSMGPR